MNFFLVLGNLLHGLNDVPLAGWSSRMFVPLEGFPLVTSNSMFLPGICDSVPIEYSFKIMNIEETLNIVI